MGALANLVIVLIVVATAWFFGGEILAFLGQAAHLIFFELGWAWFCLALYLLWKQSGDQPILARHTPHPVLSDELKFWGFVIALVVVVFLYGAAAWNVVAPLVNVLGQTVIGIVPI